MKLMVIDGNSIVNRAFYGIRMLNAPDGTPTNAVYGFIAILQHAMAEESPDALCVTFDLKAPTFRHKQYEGYKAQRKPMPDELAVQMPVLKRVLDAMNIPRYELEGWEADDLIGTISKEAEAKGWQCCIVTGDKDSFQLATDNVYIKHVKTRMGRTETKRYDRAAFREEYGFEPAGMIDLKALMGDSSDNIPGVTGIGEKTAMDLIQRFGSVERIYAALEELDIKDSVRKKLDAGREQAKMSYELATINCGVPIDIDFEETKLCPPDNDALYGVFKELGFTKYIEKFALTPPADAQESAQVFTGTCTMEYVLSLADAEAAAEEMVKSGAAVYVRCEPDISLAVLHMDVSDSDAKAWALDKERFEGDYAAAVRLLFAPDIPKAGHDIKDIQRALLEYGAAPENWVFDSALAAYLLDATAGDYKLRRLCVKYCGFEPYGGAPEQENQQLSLLDAPPDEEKERADRYSVLASEAAAIACLRDVLDKKLTELGMEKLYYEIELPLCPVLAKME
ncbi:MAG: DNA polymerase I, partial [Oscillospiraceae bacterium]|nr:DNA polymerase I [Oscillospiraceae bacterium]